MFQGVEKHSNWQFVRLWCRWLFLWQSHIFECPIRKNNWLGLGNASFCLSLYSIQKYVLKVEFVYILSALTTDFVFVFPSQPNWGPKGIADNTNSTFRIQENYSLMFWLSKQYNTNMMIVYYQTIFESYWPLCKHATIWMKK